MRVLGGNDFALLGQADLPVHRARRLREDRLVARPAAAPDRAAAAVEESQRQRMRVAQAVEQFDQRRAGAIQLPVAGEKSAVLVAVAVAEHDVLHRAGARDHAGDAGQRVKAAHDGGGIAQVADLFEQRHDDQIVHGVGVQRPAHEPGFLLQHQHFEQIAHVFGVRNDVVAQCLAPVAREHGGGGFEYGELGTRVLE